MGSLGKDRHQTPVVLLFEDDVDLREALVQSLQLENFAVEAFARVEDLPDPVSHQFNGVVISDIRLPGTDGRQLFRTIKSLDADIPVILITGHGELQEAVDLMHEGVYDFISKPFAPMRLLTSVRNAMEHRELVLDNRRIRQRNSLEDVPLPLMGESERISHLRTLVRDLAGTDVGVLLVGETGTGKEAVARALHERSGRHQRSFSVLDCASLPDTLLEAELFGREEVVNGMRRQKIGRLEAADRGTLFLDGVDCLSMTAQGQLLRALEQRRITPLGGHSSRAISCRLVSAATRDLARLCQEGAFRADLYFHLNTITLHLPSLRERREDIATLFLALLAHAATRLKRPAPTLTKSVKARLFEHGWPGNIRELSHYADRVVLGMEQMAGPLGEGASESLPDLVDRFEASLIREALRVSGGSVKESIEMLRIPRKTFYDKISRHGIDLQALRSDKLVSGKHRAGR